MAQFSEQDLILLNSYLDGRLGSSERAEIEGRLAGDAALRDELDALRGTVELLKKAERVPVPRNFTLDPAAYAAPARRSFWERFSLGPMPGWAVATASLVMVAIFAGALLLRSTSGGGPSTVAMAPMTYAEATEEGTEAPAYEAMTEAMTEAPMPEVMTDETAPEGESTEMAMFAATMEATEEGAASKSAPPLPQGTEGPPFGGATGGGATDGGGDNGGQPGGMGGGIEPTSPSMLAQSAPTENVDTYDTTSESAGDAAAASGPAGNTAPEDGQRGLATQPPEVVTLDVTEADPTAGLRDGSWVILVIGSVLLVALVIGITFMRRRR